MTPTLSRPGTNCTILTIGPHVWYFSYETLVAYRGPNVPGGTRRTMDISHSTADHMRRMGVYDWERSESMFCDKSSISEKVPV